MYIYRHDRTSLVLAVVVVLSMISAMSCTRAMLVSDDEWDRPDSEYEGDYLIHTVDGRDIEARRFARTDSSLIIHETGGNNEVNAADPLELPLDEIESIRKTKYWLLGTVVGIPIVGLLAFGVAMAILFHDFHVD